MSPFYFFSTTTPHIHIFFKPQRFLKSFFISSRKIVYFVNSRSINCVKRYFFTVFLLILQMFVFFFSFTCTCTYASLRKAHYTGAPSQQGLRFCFLFVFKEETRKWFYFNKLYDGNATRTIKMFPPWRFRVCVRVCYR